MTTVEVLRAARAKLTEPDMWVKGAEDASTAPYCCTMTAIDRVYPVHEPDAVYQAARSAVVRAFGAPHSGFVFDWNDAPERTLEDVLALYDKAIALAEARP